MHPYNSCKAGILGIGGVAVGKPNALGTQSLILVASFNLR